MTTNNIFLKSKASCFSNKKLKEYLLGKNIEVLEFAGIVVINMLKFNIRCSKIRI